MESSSSRLADRETGAVRRRPTIRVVLVTMIVLAPVAFATSRSPVFRLRHVDVVGTSRLSRADVLRGAGISATTNVLWFDTGAVARRLEQDPWIAKAIVSRRVPWTVRIRVVERRPVAALDVENAYTLVSGDGVALGTVPTDPGLPLIILPHPVPGAGPDFQGAARAIAALGACPGCGVQVAKVRQDGTLRIVLASGVNVDYGSTSDIQAKTAAVGRIIRWARAGGTSLASIDVSAPGTPAVTYG